jgi:hypothetical protein
MDLKPDNKQLFKRAALSTACLLSGFLFMQFLQWVFIFTGSYLSDFQGNIKWHDFIFYATAKQWNFKQVLSLFLLPDLVFFIMYLVLSIRKKRFVDKPVLFHLFYSWFYLLLTVRVLFLPLWQIVDKNGVYYALSWLRISRTEQLITGMVLMTVYLLTVFRISTMFSSGLMVQTKRFLNKKIILPQLIFLWLIPFLVFTLLLFFFSGNQISFPNNYLIGGVAFILLVNIPVISNYKVIVN